MDPGFVLPLLVTLVGAGLVGGIALVRRRFDRWQRARHYSIQAAPEGVPVRVTGRVRSAGALLRAPLTGRACVAYEATVAGADRTLGRELAGGTFVIEDETGRAIVGLAAASFEARLVNPVRFGGSDDLRPELHQFAARSIKPRPLDLEEAVSEYSFADAIVADGDEVTVLGIGRREADPEVADYRAPARRLRLSGAGNAPLGISNDARTGPNPSLAEGERRAGRTRG